MGAFNEDATKTLLLRKSNFEEQKWKIFFLHRHEEEEKNLENGPSSPFVLKEASKTFQVNSPS